MNASLLTQLENIDSELSSAFITIETFLSNNVSNSDLIIYTEQLDRGLSLCLDWYGDPNRAYLVNSYIQVLSGYLQVLESFPNAVPPLLNTDSSPYALLDQGNFVGTLKNAEPSVFLDSTEPHGTYLTNFFNNFETQGKNAGGFLARFANRLQTRVSALHTWQSFEELETNQDYNNENIRRIIYEDFGWGEFIRQQGLDDQGIYSFPRNEDFQVAILDPIDIPFDDPSFDPSLFIQYVTTGDIPFFVRDGQFKLRFNPSEDGILSWETGSVTFMSDTNRFIELPVSSGSIEYNQDRIYVCYIPGREELLTTTEPNTAFINGQTIIAIYDGGFDLRVFNATRIIIGTEIAINSMPPDRISDGVMNAIIQLGQEGPLLDGKNERIIQKSGSNTLFTLGDYEGENGDTQIGWQFRDSDGNLIMDSQNGLGKEVVGSSNIKPGSIQEQHLFFGARSLEERGITVSFDEINNRVSWSSGIISWFDDLGNNIETSIIAGQAFYEGQALFILWERGSDRFISTTDVTLAFDSNNFYVFAQYSGSNQLVRNFQTTQIEGARIRTGSIEANRLSANSIFSQLLFLGSENFRLDGIERNILIKDELDQTRVKIGRIGISPTDYGMEVRRQDGKLVLGVDGLGLDVVSGENVLTNSIPFDATEEGTSLSKTLIIGLDGNLLLEGNEHRIRVTDDNDNTRVILGRIGLAPERYGIKIFDDQGNVMLDSVDGSFGRLDTQITGINEAINNIIENGGGSSSDGGQSSAEAAALSAQEAADSATASQQNLDIIQNIQNAVGTARDNIEDIQDLIVTIGNDLGDALTVVNSERMLIEGLHSQTLSFRDEAQRIFEDSEGVLTSTVAQVEGIISEATDQFGNQITAISETASVAETVLSDIEQIASLINVERDAVNTARSEAQGFRNETFEARDDVFGTVATVENIAGIIAQSETDIGDFVTASSTNAQRAETAVSDAESVATLINAERELVETARSQTLGFRNETFEARDDALGSASAAETARGLAVDASNNAGDSASASLTNAERAETAADDSGEFASASQASATSANTSSSEAFGFRNESFNARDDTVQAAAEAFQSSGVAVDASNEATQTLGLAIETLEAIANIEETVVRTTETLQAQFAARNLSGGQLLPNWNFSEVDLNNRPFGIAQTDSGSVNIDQISVTNFGLRIEGSPDPTVSFGFPAIPVDRNLEYSIRVFHKSDSESGQGLQLAIRELDGFLTEGQTHIDSSNSTRRVVLFNGGMPGPLPTEVIFNYKPSENTQFVTLEISNWIGYDQGYEVESIQINNSIESVVNNFNSLVENEQLARADENEATALLIDGISTLANENFSGLQTVSESVSDLTQSFGSIETNIATRFTNVETSDFTDPQAWTQDVTIIPGRSIIEYDRDRAFFRESSDLTGSSGFGPHILVEDITTLLSQTRYRTYNSNFSARINFDVYLRTLTNSGITITIAVWLFDSNFNILGVRRTLRAETLEEIGPHTISIERDSEWFNGIVNDQPNTVYLRFGVSVNSDISNNSIELRGFDIVYARDIFEIENSISQLETAISSEEQSRVTSQNEFATEFNQNLAEFGQSIDLISDDISSAFERTSLLELSNAQRGLLPNGSFDIPNAEGDFPANWSPSTANNLIYEDDPNPNRTGKTVTFESRIGSISAIRFNDLVVEPNKKYIVTFEAEILEGLVESAAVICQQRNEGGNILNSSTFLATTPDTSGLIEAIPSTGPRTWSNIFETTSETNELRIIVLANSSGQSGFFSKIRWYYVSLRTLEGGEVIALENQSAILNERESRLEQISSFTTQFLGDLGDISDDLGDTNEAVSNIEDTLTLLSDDSQSTIDDLSELTTSFNQNSSSVDQQLSLLSDENSNRVTDLERITLRNAQRGLLINGSFEAGTYGNDIPNGWLNFGSGNTRDLIDITEPFNTTIIRFNTLDNINSGVRQFFDLEGLKRVEFQIIIQMISGVSLSSGFRLEMLDSGNQTISVFDFRFRDSPDINGLVSELPGKIRTFTGIFEVPEGTVTGELVVAGSSSWFGTRGITTFDVHDVSMRTLSEASTLALSALDLINDEEQARIEQVNNLSTTFGGRISDVEDEINGSSGITQSISAINQSIGLLTDDSQSTIDDLSDLTTNFNQNSASVDQQLSLLSDENSNRVSDISRIALRSSRQGLLSNGNFEGGYTSNIPNGWTNLGDSSVRTVVDITEPINSTVLRFEVGLGGTAGLSQRINIEGNKTVELIFRAQILQGNAQGSGVILSFQNENFTGISNYGRSFRNHPDINGDISSLPGDIRQWSEVVEVPENAKYILVSPVANHGFLGPISDNIKVDFHEVSVNTLSGSTALALSALDLINDEEQSRIDQVNNLSTTFGGRISDLEDGFDGPSGITQTIASLDQAINLLSDENDARVSQIDSLITQTGELSSSIQNNTNLITTNGFSTAVELGIIRAGLGAIDGRLKFANRESFTRIQSITAGNANSPLLNSYIVFNDPTEGLILVNQASNINFNFLLVRERTSCVEGDEVTIGVRYRFDAGIPETSGRSVWLEVVVYRDDGSTTRLRASSQTAFPSNWTIIEGSVTIPSGYTSYRPAITLGSSSNGAQDQRIYLDWIENTKNLSQLREIREATFGPDGSFTRWELGGSVGGASNFISATAMSQNGVASSNLSIGADSIALFNTIGDEFREVLVFENGDALLLGSLIAGGGASLGNGSIKYPFALESFNVSLSDGESHDYGVDFGVPARITFDTSNLPALEAGQVYQISAVNSTGEGFSLRAKKRAAGTLTNRVISSDLSVSGYDRGIAAANNAEAFNGQYVLSVNVDLSTQGSNFGSSNSFGLINIFVHNGSNVVLVAAVGVGGSGNPSNGVVSFTTDVSFSYSGLLRNSSWAIAVEVDSPISSDRVTRINNLRYQTQSTATETTATIDGREVNCIVEPRNA